MNEAPKTRAWTANFVEAEQRTIRDELSCFESNKAHKPRLRHILGRIKELEDDTSNHGLLRRYIFTVSALVHHERFGGLKESQIKSISDIALGILKIQNVDPATSRLGFLYGDLHLVKSQIYRKMGNQWKAAWEQQISRQFSGRTLSQGEARQALATAIRSARLGNASFAIRNFIEAEQGGLAPRALIRARLGLIQTYRLSGRHEQCRAVIENTSQIEGLGDAERLDLQWETLLLETGCSSDLTNLVKAVIARSSHHKAAYFLEAYLYTKAVSDRRWESRIAKVSSMARSRSLNVHKQGFLYRCVRTIEECYDLELPFAHRLQNLGEVLAERNNLVGIDKELMLLAAATVWLNRNRSLRLASLVLNEYQALSLRLSDGRRGDALGLMGEMLDKPWYQAPDDLRLSPAVSIAEPEQAKT